MFMYTRGKNTKTHPGELDHQGVVLQPEILLLLQEPLVQCINGHVHTRLLLQAEARQDVLNLEYVIYI